MGIGGVRGCCLATMGAGWLGLELSEGEEGISGQGGLPRQSGATRGMGDGRGGTKGSCVRGVRVGRGEGRANQFKRTLKARDLVWMHQVWGVQRIPGRRAECPKRG